VSTLCGSHYLRQLIVYYVIQPAGVNEWSGNRKFGPSCLQLHALPRTVLTHGDHVYKARLPTLKPFSQMIGNRIRRFNTTKTCQDPGPVLFTQPCILRLSSYILYAFPNDSFPSHAKNSACMPSLPQLSYAGVSKSFRTESIMKYMLTTIHTRWEVI